jgi:hypothetical protein
MVLPANPLDAQDTLDKRVGILERKSQGFATNQPQSFASRLYTLTSQQAIGVASWTTITSLSEYMPDSHDPDNAISFNPATGTITCNKDGLYTLWINFQGWNPFTDISQKLVRFVRNRDSHIIADNGKTVSQAPIAQPRVFVSVTLWCAAGETFAPQFYSSYAVTLLTSSFVGNYSAMMVVYHGGSEPKGDPGPPGPPGIPGAAVAVYDEFTIVEPNVSQLNFTGPGITASSSGPGAVRVDVQATGSGGSGGTNEVWIGTTPSDPNIELWYDPSAMSAPPTDSWTFVQGTAATVWVINHPLTFYPNVTIVDSAGSQVEGSVVYTDADTVTVTFSAAFAGTAYLS